MKLSVLALAGTMLAVMPVVQAAPMIGVPARNSLVQEAHVTCAYLTEDGYCVRSHKRHKYWKRYHDYRPAYRTYEPQPPDEDYWRYQRPRPIIRVVPNYRRGTKTIGMIGTIETSRGRKLFAGVMHVAQRWPRFCGNDMHQSTT